MMALMMRGMNHGGKDHQGMDHGGMDHGGTRPIDGPPHQTHGRPDVR